MTEEKNGRIILYTSQWCAHARSVEGYLSSNDIAFQKINIDGDQEARSELKEINGGYASVPTLIFPDGTKLTEPSISNLRGKLDLETPVGLKEKIWAALGQRKKTHNL